MKKLTVFLFLTLFYSFVNAKDSDFTTWTNWTANVKLCDKVSVAGTLEYRTKDSASQTDRWNFLSAVTYKLLPYFNIGAGYELQLLQNNSHWNNRHRYQVSLGENFSAGRFSFTFRERFQHTIDSGDNDFQLRTRAQVKFKACELARPYTYVEFFNSLNKGNSFDLLHTRCFFGTELKINSVVSVSPYYGLCIYEDKLKHVAGVDFNFYF